MICVALRCEAFVIQRCIHITPKSGWAGGHTYKRNHGVGIGKGIVSARELNMGWLLGGWQY